tara:strand:+ start:256 stop:717 length:462 start_codon:yes stop_codon:yes gene_type:complete
LALYECVFIARQDISPVQVESLSEQFETIIKDHGGSIAKREIWGLRTLAYKIKKNRKGHYVLFNVDSAPAGLHEMERQMRLHEDVLRYMTVCVDTHDEEPSVIMQSRNKEEEPTSASDQNVAEKKPTNASIETSTKPDVTTSKKEHVNEEPAA